MQSGTRVHNPLTLQTNLRVHYELGARAALRRYAARPRSRALDHSERVLMRQISTPPPCCLCSFARTWLQATRERWTAWRRDAWSLNSLAAAATRSRRRSRIAPQTSGWTPRCAAPAGRTSSARASTSLSRDGLTCLKVRQREGKPVLRQLPAGRIAAPRAQEGHPAHMSQRAYDVYRAAVKRTREDVVVVCFAVTPSLHCACRKRIERTRAARRPGLRV